VKNQTEFSHSNGKRDAIGGKAISEHIFLRIIIFNDFKIMKLKKQFKIVFKFILIINFNY